MDQHHHQLVQYLVVVDITISNSDIDYVQIMSLGNAVDFGDLTDAR